MSSDFIFLLWLPSSYSNSCRILFQHNQGYNRGQSCIFCHTVINLLSACSSTTVVLDINSISYINSELIMPLFLHSLIMFFLVPLFTGTNRKNGFDLLIQWTWSNVAIYFNLLQSELQPMLQYCITLRRTGTIWRKGTNAEWFFWNITTAR